MAFADLLTPLRVLTAAICLLVVPCGAAGQETLREKPPRRPKAAAPAFTPEREAAAMTFVREHHAEVAELLERLKANHPAQYRRAASQLFRASERLAQWKVRDPARYDLELKAWKIQSRIQVLLARSAMSVEANVAADVDESLRAALAEQIKVRLALRKHDREQLERRLALAEKDIARLEKDKDAAIERQLVALRKGIDKSRGKLKAKRESHNKPPSREGAK